MNPTRILHWYVASHNFRRDSIRALAGKITTQEKEAMKKLMFTSVLALLLFCRPFAQVEEIAMLAQAKPVVLPVNGAAVPTRLAVRNPAATAELQIIGLSVSQTQNTLGESLAEINKRLRGLLKQIRQPTALRGEFGGRLLLEPQAGSTGENGMLLIRLGNSQTLPASNR